MKTTCWFDSDVKGLGLDTAAALILALVDTAATVSGRTDECVFVWKYFSRKLNERRCRQVKQGNEYYTINSIKIESKNILKSPS